MANVWFTSDLHLGHKNILLHCPERVEKLGLQDLLDEEAVSQHDERIIEIWNSMVGKYDDVYVLGDFIFSNKERATKILKRLKGKKHFLIGNHDGTIKKFKPANQVDDEYGEYDGEEILLDSIDYIKCKTFKRSLFPFLEENLHVVMCHYPIEIWPSKHHGWIHLHGHLHGRLDDVNNTNKELRVDVGIDGRLADFKLVSLEDVYRHFRKITNGTPFEEYVCNMRETQQKVM